MEPRKLIDYHTHTAVTIDCRMTEEQACEQAIAANVQEIAFTNHVMLTQPDYTISPESLIKHWEQIQVCQQRYPGLSIRLGLEMDYYAGRDHEIAALIASYENLIGRRFDLVLGSVHHLRGIFFSEKNRAPELFREQNTISLYHDYFALAAHAAQSQLFNVMAHPDLIKKYTGTLSPRVAFEEYRAAAELYVDALIESGVGLEINTKGFKLAVGEAYPSDQLLELYIRKAKAKNIAPIVTLGADAHKAEDVGGLLAEGALALRRAGHTTLTRFDCRRPIPFVLD